MTETRRIEKIEVKLTPAEKAQLETDWSVSNAVSLSAYVRARLLNEAPKPFDPDALMGDEDVVRVVPKKEVPDAAPTVGPTDPLPARPYDDPEIQTTVHEGFIDQELEFKKWVNRYATRMPRRKAEAIVKKEMGL